MTRTKLKPGRGPKADFSHNKARKYEIARTKQDNRKRKREEASSTPAEGPATKKPKGGATGTESGQAEEGGRDGDEMESEGQNITEAEPSEQMEDSNATTTTTNTTTVSWPPTLPASPLLIQLSKSYALTHIFIASQHSIQKKTTQALKLLETYPTPEGEKPALVVLKSKGKTACKLITVVEICKREIAAMEGKEGKGKWFQYSAVEGVLGEKVTHKTKAPAKEGTEGTGDGEEEVDEDGFETMKTPFERAIEGKPEVRQMPYMTVYLSRVRIEALRKAFGEQTNGLEAIN